jgi:Kef-type K+ transport system membrane component KefB
MDHGVFEQIALVLVVCVAAGGLAVLLRQPLLVGLLVAGVLVGPGVFGLVTATPEVELLGEIGIALLLFVVGLKLDPRLVRRLGPVVLIAGGVQVALTAGPAFVIALGFGIDTTGALYLGAAMAFSSTVIVVKVLTDRRELEQLHGRIAVGILIVQDLVVVLLMIGLATIDPDSGVGLVSQAGAVLLRGIALLALVFVAARWVLPRVTHVLARQGELLVLASVTWAIGLAALAIVLGFSGEVGAFLAGTALASSEYRDAISGRLSTLRDFLLVFFFIDLGVRLELGGVEDLLLVAALSAFILVGKPLIVALITTRLRFRARVGVRSGLTLAQISEFSLILVALGVGLGHVDGRIVGIVTGVALVTITASSFLSARSAVLVPRLSPPLERFERAPVRPESPQAGALPDPSVVVIGLGRLGQTVVSELDERGEDVLGVDFDPRSIRGTAYEIPVLYGDAEDPELPHHLPLSRARWVVSTLRDLDAHRTLIAALRHHGFAGRIAVAVDHEEDGEVADKLGVDLIVRPLHEAAGPFVERLCSHPPRERSEEPTAG